MSLPPASAEPSVAEAGVWLDRGHACRAAGDLLAALACYDRARDACEKSSSSDPYPLGLAWMNRGNVLQQLGRPGESAATIDAYDQALAVFEGTAGRPEVALSLGAAWLNRGRAHLDAGDFGPAAIDFRRALERLRPLAAAGHPAAVRNLAGAAVNLSQVLLVDPAPAPEVLALAGEVRRALADRVATEPAAAALSLEASRLELAARERDLSRATIGEFTDVLENALSLAGAWLPRDHLTAAPLSVRLFHLGAATYAQSQPQFLIEYLRDGLDPGVGPAPFAGLPGCHAAAREVLAELRRDLDRPRLLRASDDAAHHLAALRSALDAPMPWLLA